MKPFGRPIHELLQAQGLATGASEDMKQMNWGGMPASASMRLP